MSGITRAQSALINAHCQVEHSDNQSETSPSYNLDGSIPSSLTNANVSHSQQPVTVNLRFRCEQLLDNSSVGVKRTQRKSIVH